MMCAAPIATPAVLGCAVALAFGLLAPVPVPPPDATPQQPAQLLPVAASCGRAVVLDGAVAPEPQRRRLRT